MINDKKSMEVISECCRFVTFFDLAIAGGPLQVYNSALSHLSKGSLLKLGYEECAKYSLTLLFTVVQFGTYFEFETNFENNIFQDKRRLLNFMDFTTFSLINNIMKLNKVNYTSVIFSKYEGDRKSVV